MMAELIPQGLRLGLVFKLMFPVFLSSQYVQQKNRSSRKSGGVLTRAGRSISEYNKDKKEKCRHRKQLIAKVKA